MSSSKFDTLYVGGSSFSEGGGLYQPDIKDLYKEIANGIPLIFIIVT